VSVAVLNGRLPVLGGRLLSASLAGHEKSKQFIRGMVSVSRGVDTSLLMKLRLLMKTATPCSQGSEFVLDKIVAIRNT
jgi:hypothetical protein